MRFKKYDSFEEIKTGQEIQIHSNNAWNGLFGVIENINKTEKRVEIFSMEYPDFKYIVSESNLSDIEMVVE